MTKTFFVLAFISTFSLVSFAQNTPSVDLNQLKKSPSAPINSSKAQPSYRVAEPPRTSIDLNDLQNFVPEPPRPAPKKIAPTKPASHPSQMTKIPTSFKTKLKIKFLNAMSETQLQSMSEDWASELKMSFHPTCGLSRVVGYPNCSFIDKTCTVILESQNCQFTEMAQSCPAGKKNVYFGRNNREHKGCVQLPQEKSNSTSYQQSIPRNSLTGSGAQ